MNIPETLEAFGEGVQYTTDQGWVDPRDIEDTELCLAYHGVVNAWQDFKKKARDFDTLLYAKAEEAQ